MKLILSLLFLAAMTLRAHAMDRFEALSQIESGDNDLAIGTSGEVSRYQILPAVWQETTNELVTVEHHYLDFSPTVQLDAKIVAETIMIHRWKGFLSKYHRDPTDQEFYLLWHRPARVLHGADHRPRAVEAERAQRFANLCAVP